MMSWEEFEDYDKETLQQELAEWYWCLAKTTIPDAYMLDAGYEIIGMTQSEYIKYMKDAILPTDTILKYITEYALEKDDGEDQTRDLIGQLSMIVLQSDWPDKIESITVNEVSVAIKRISRRPRMASQIMVCLSQRVISIHLR
jgi:hypothetical protein